VAITSAEMTVTTAAAFLPEVWANDTIDAVDPDKLRQATCAMAVFAYQIGRSTADLGRASGAALTSTDDEH
jgi:hypothetical protein